MLRERDGADVAAAVAQRAERRDGRRAADDVEDGVHPLADIERLAVDDLRDAVRPCAVAFLRPHGAHDLGPGCSGQADRERADAAEWAVDQHTFAVMWLQAAMACSAVSPHSGSAAAAAGEAPSGHGPGLPRRARRAWYTFRDTS